MSDTQTTDTVTPTPDQAVLTPPTLNFKLSPADVLTQLQSYTGQADKTLAQLQSNIDAATNQVKEWQRMQLMIVGQKQLVADLTTKLVDTAPTTTTTVS